MLILQTIWQSAAFRHAIVGAGSGIVIAVRADREAFKNWKCWHDVATFDWGVASFRYAKGAVIGGVGAGAFGAWLG